MKVSFNRAAFAEALGLVTTIVPSRTPKPILRCLKIIAEGKETHVCATDLEVGINYAVSEVQVEKPGEVVVSADHLAAIVRESIDEVLLLDEAEGACHIKGADSHFTIYGQEAGQYPQVPVFENSADLEVPLGSLKIGIEQCLFAAAKESSRYAINGVLWDIKDKKLQLVATDGRRLARSRVTLSQSPQKTAKGVSLSNIIVPAKTMALLEKVGGGEKETVMVKLNENQIIFKCAGIIISSNLVEGNFPKYEEIIPTDYDKKLTLPTEAALSAVRRAALLTSEESRGIKITIRKDKIVFSARSPETGDAEVDMVTDYAGEPIDIGFNPQFLIDILRVIKTQQFELELGQPDRPGVIKSGTNFIYVLMPINLG
jgi:DNA polymerase-3 subunit beta